MSSSLNLFIEPTSANLYMLIANRYRSTLGKIPEDSMKWYHIARFLVQCGVKNSYIGNGDKWPDYDAMNLSIYI